jgi:hypothetical protein
MNIDAWHGPSGFDVRHRTSISGVYDLPFGSGRRWMSRAGRVLQGLVGGDSGRGILHGPGHTVFDTSLSKRFSVGDRANAEFRWGCVQPVQSRRLRLPECRHR